MTRIARRHHGAQGSEALGTSHDGPVGSRSDWRKPRRRAAGGASRERVACAAMERSRRLALLLVNVVPVAVPPAQDSRPATRPAASPAAGPRREGGFVGLTVTETPWLGRRALAVH